MNGQGIFLSRYMNVSNQRENTGVTYQDAGVNLSASQVIKERIKKVAKKTYGKNVLGGVGGFGAMYRLGDYREPILVSSTDPVGTKLMVATMADDFSSVGADLVNACVNDLIVIGADPLFFLDYVATSIMDPVVVETIVKGIGESCQSVDCALIGGETSEMPGVFAGNNIDLSGFVVGVVEEDEMLRPLETIESGDCLIGVASNGLHTNGYSLVRHVFDLDKDHSPLSEYFEDLGESLGDALLRPHLSYYGDLKPIFKFVKGIAHITGGGLYENVPRMLPEGVTAQFNLSSLRKPPIFDFIQERGSIQSDEMYKVFNMGLGMVIACDFDQAPLITSRVSNSEIIGEIIHNKVGDKVIIAT
jgi:phosphoribosylformylglycinamidine cyclo-ligase